MRSYTATHQDLENQDFGSSPQKWRGKWLERLAPVRRPGVSPGVRLRKAGRLRNGLARDAPATMEAGIPQIFMRGSNCTGK